MTLALKMADIEYDSYEKGFDKGREDGLQVGLQQGLKQGIEQGIEQEKIHTVVTLIEKLNLPFDEVIKLLNVPENLIESCKKHVQSHV